MKITRRDFCAGLGSALLLPTSARLSAAVNAEPNVPAYEDTDPAGGFTLKPPRQFLFTDLRNIDPGDLVWRSPDGKALPIAGPPEPPVEALADIAKVPRGVRIVAQPATKEGPVEGLYWVVVYDGGLYRSWRIKANYPGKDLEDWTEDEPNSLTVSYGQSKDGYSWSWRATCEVKVSGQTGIDGAHFFIDPHGPESERYKCIYTARIIKNVAEHWNKYQKLHPRYRDCRLNANYIYGMFALVSPDGLEWKAVPEPLMIHKGDTDNTVYYDSWLGKYVMYTRLLWLDRRMVTRAESDDFYHWLPPSPIIGPELSDPVYCDVYTNARTTYPDMPEQHLMFPCLYNRFTQTSEVYLYSSLDGLGWLRVPGGPILKSGGPGDWDAGFIMAGKNLVPLGSDKIAVPYYGCPYPHSYPRWQHVKTQKCRWAVWPKGRLAALAADEQGEFHTFVMQITGNKLSLNARVKRAGEIRVGINYVEGRSVENCDPIFGDSTSHIVTWKGNSDVLAAPGNQVILHFKLRAAELFGFEWV